MAIIRSKIARQLLAEGGVSLDDAKMMAPEGEFLAYINPKEAGILRSMGGSGKMTPMGIPSFTEDEEDQLAMDAPDYSSQDLEEQAAIDAGEPTAQMSTMARDFQGFGGGDNLSDLQAPTFFQNLGTGISNLVGQGRRGQNILNFLNRSTAPTMRGRLGLGRRGDINYILEQLQANKGDPVAIGLTDKQFEIGQKLIDAGIKDETDIRNMTQSQFDTLFPGPNTGGGGDGDNEPIKKLRAPITEKKEEPKKEFDDILKFYGARFAKGGSTGFEGSPEMGGRGTEDTYGFDQSGPAGSGGDNEGGPPTVEGDGTEPPMLSGGRGIDVGALQKQGLTPAEIATVFNEYYGLDTTPTAVGTLGPLGTSPSPMMGQVPGITNLGTKGTTGAKGTGGLGFAFTPEAPIAIDKVFGSGLRERSKMYEDVFKADGGEVRQEYGLGSIVKKATRAVKKVAKSPLGKAALFYAGTFGIPGTSFKGLSGLDSFKNLSALQKAFLVGGTALTLSPFATEEEEEKLPTVANTDPEMTKFINFYGGPTRFASEGGDIDEAPIKMASHEGNTQLLERLYEDFIDMGFSPKDAAKKAQEAFDEMTKKRNMPRQGIERATAAGGGMMNPNDEMLNLGGNEMDLRGGGFVPLGEYEKKDDVPARLSKNEFVFTADAVRAAGGGSVDKGADVMYKTMKTLENKVA